MHGHLPGSPPPHVPVGLGPLIGYVATREPRPFDERPPSEPAPWMADGEASVLDDFADVGEWEPLHRPLVRVVAVLVSLSLVLAGVGTVLELLLSAR